MDVHCTPSQALLGTRSTLVTEFVINWVLIFFLFQLSDLLEKCKSVRSKEEEKLGTEDVILTKKMKLDDSAPPFLARVPYDTALHNYYSWHYDTWASLSQALPFGPWPSLPHLPTDKRLPKSLKDRWDDLKSCIVATYRPRLAPGTKSL